VRVRCLALAATLAGVLLPASVAHAGTAYVAGRVLHYDGLPGVSEQLWVAGNDEVVALNASSGMTLGAGCVTAFGQTQCATSGFDSIEVKLGDMDDWLTLYGSVTPLNVDAGPGDDQLGISGEYGPMSLDGGEGDDTVLIQYVSAGFDDVFSGGPGRDTWSVNTSRPLFIHLDGMANDGLLGEHDNVKPDFEVVRGGPSTDVIEGSPGADELHGGSGADVIEGLGGDDKLYGDYDGPCEHDVLDGGDGNDTLALDGVSYADGGPGDDTLVAPDFDCGSEDVRGGSGTDTLDYRADHTPDMWVSLDGVPDDGRRENDDFASDIETVLGNDAGMFLIGGPGPNRLVGGAGDDLLDGAGGTDVLIGGGGEDVADYSGHTGPVWLSLDGDDHDGSPGENENLGSDIEDLRGGLGDDVLIGDGGDNVLDGGPGADSISGGGGLDAVDYSDRERNLTVSLDGNGNDDGEYGEGDNVHADVEGVFGGTGSDVLIGNASNGFLYGGWGPDTLTDRGGRDILSGGDSDDVIDGADGAQDALQCGLGNDVAYRDDNDVATGCEASNLGPKPDPPTTQRIDIGTIRPRQPTTRLPLTPAKRADTRAPVATVKVSGRLSRLAVAVSCDEACSVSATVTAQGHKTVLAKGSLRALATGKRTLHPTLTHAGRRVRHGRFRIALTLADAAGNARHVSVRVKA
jgi:Ca2+-binding RTX toxin-like protein